MRKLESKDFVSMPWKNGAGTTLELFKVQESSSSNFKLRLSVAKIQENGPFSHFPGIDRELAILEGFGVTLNFSNKQVHLMKGESILKFTGESHIDCILKKGTVVDFNTMVDRNWGKVESSFSAGENIICESYKTFIYDHAQKLLTILDQTEHVFAPTGAIVTNLWKNN